MKLTMLGSAASYAGPGHACSGMLVESGGTRIVVDLGTGTLANLGAVTDPASVAGIFVTHAHPDHFLDLYALQALLRYAPEGPAGPLRLFCPDGLVETMGALLSERGRKDLADAFEVEELRADRQVALGGVFVTPRAVDHVGDTFALVLEARDARACYTSDTRYGDAVLAAAAGADVLVAECTLPEQYAGMMPHMTAREAGTLAQHSGARVLVLTHLWPTVSRDELLRGATETFDGEILLATELLSIDVKPGTRPGRKGRRP